MLVVWEPVIVTDLGPPSSRTLSRVTDPRAVQYWDKGRSLSRAILGAARKNPAVLSWDSVDEESIVWDWVAVFPRGATWDGDSFPAPAFSGNPVVGALDGLRGSLSTGPAR